MNVSMYFSKEMLLNIFRLSSLKHKKFYYGLTWDKSIGKLVKEHVCV